MIGIIRSIICLMLVFLTGDICGLTIHFLTHLNHWANLQTNQVILLVLVSLIVAFVEAVEHEPPSGDDHAKCTFYMHNFFLSLLITLVATYKPQ